MNSADETIFFERVDEYARTNFRSFLTEMFLNEPKTEYTLCFRPIGVSRESPEHYACRYVRVPALEAALSVRQQLLTRPILESLTKPLEELAMLE